MAPLTKEEKKAKKEAKRLEKLRLEEELRKSQIRDELQRELAAQAVRRTELDRTWRARMLKIKEPLFRQDVEVMWQTFERAYDKKDYLISYTIRLMETADNQFQRTVSSFCDTVDTMINKFLIDLEEMSKDNNRRTAELLKRGEDDATQIMADHDAAETHLQLLLYHAHASADTRAWTTRGENAVKEDEERDQYHDEREHLRSFLENAYVSMWDEYKAVLRAYVAGTSEIQKQVRVLRRKEQAMADVIASQEKKILNSGGIIRKLRTELQQYESGTKQAEFRDRRNRHRVARAQLKQDMIEGLKKDADQMARLVRAADDTSEWLEAGYKKGERVLQLAGLCRHYETQREKILPLGCTPSVTPVQSDCNLQRKSSAVSLVGTAITWTSGLTRLWQRTAKAELSLKALQREKMLLQRQNEELMLKLENQGEEDNMTPDVQRCMCNDLQKTEVKKNPLVSGPVAIEGALVFRKYRKHYSNNN